MKRVVLLFAITTITVFGFQLGAAPTQKLKGGSTSDATAAALRAKAAFAYQICMGKLQQNIPPQKEAAAAPVGTVSGVNLK